MANSLVWISGASSGIGQAMAQTVPWDDTRLIGMSRHAGEGSPGVEHLAVDLSDPAGWQAAGDSFRGELAAYAGGRVVFVHAAGTLDPIGFAGDVDTDAYVANVLLNSAAPQVLGHLFLAAARDVDADRHLIMLTSGAARSVYPGWTSYGAGKAAIDQWVRNAGAEQSIRGGVRVIAVAPGTVRTDMQAMLRGTSAEEFPQRQKFIDLHANDELANPNEVATRIWSLVDRGLNSGSVVDLRDRQ